MWLYKKISASAISIWIVSVSGCSAEGSKYLASDLNAINHTASAVNRFSVDGYGGKNTPPHGFGGGACCVLMPREWRPGLTVLVEWETDPDPYADSPSLGTEEFREFMLAHKKNYKRHSAYVEIPRYEASTLCSLKIHFLPCNKLKATTACTVYKEFGYPIREPIVMKEPAACLK